MVSEWEYERARRWDCIPSTLLRVRNQKNQGTLSHITGGIHRITTKRSEAISENALQCGGHRVTVKLND
jgi:hypothetical protein